MDELTLLRELIRDEPMDDEAARAEVWGRLLEAETPSRRRTAVGRPRAGLRQRVRRHRIAAALAGAVIVLVGTAAAFATVREVFFEEYFPQGRVTRTVDGVRFSFEVAQTTRSGWENGPSTKTGNTSHTGRLFISKDLERGQAAEAVIFWTAFPRGGEATPCSKTLEPGIGRSTAALAAAMAAAPGIKLIRGPLRVSVGGRPATHVVLRVREDRGCDPGYFFGWKPRHACWGACWLESSAGDTIRVWIVDVDGKRLVLEAETNPPSPETPAFQRADFKKVGAEITSIIDSIRFD